MASPLLVAGVSTVLICILLSYALHQRWDTMEQRSMKMKGPHEGYILRNQVTHARLLPAESRHSFTYPTVSVLVSIDALEHGRLNVLGGLLFGHGTTLGRLLGLSPKHYLERGSASLRQKLTTLLSAHGYSTPQSSHFHSAWMMTMPSIMGFEGINPLTVYFCYRIDHLWLVVLEIHNTFGETHAHVLEIGRNEDPTPPGSFNHQWTFRREFHVSPFNDRTGFYTVAVKAPSHPPTSHLSHAVPFPKPAVRIHLHTAPANLSSDSIEMGPLKLTALLRPVRAEPLDATNIMSTLTWAPFALFLSLPRILFEAWKLHYRKRLDVFIRPEPLTPLTSSLPVGGALTSNSRLAGGVAWRGDSFLERYAMQRVYSHLEKRVALLNATVTIIPYDPAVEPRCFGNPEGVAKDRQLTIWYAASRFFTILFMAPSPQHGYLLGCSTEKVFSVSSEALFLEIFSVQETAPRPHQSLQQALRGRSIPPSISVEIPYTHPFDQKSKWGTVKDTFIINISLLLDTVEASIFRSVAARVVPGDEPWKTWERAEKVLTAGEKDCPGRSDNLGSVRREL